jgi:GPH family glycoside/pentoside/hexuronide:cation symporter
MAAAAELPRHNMLLYASGSFAGNVISRTKDLWLIFFFAPPEDETDIARRSSILAVGAVLTVARVIESFDDPFIGYWSDRTRSRWGRRIPFVLFATPFWVLFFVLFWTPPDGHETIANAFYLFIVLEGFHLFSTLSGGPFESLLPEIATTSKERVGVVTWQVFFGTVGAAVALVTSGIIKEVWGFQAMGLVMASLALASRYLALAGAWGRARMEQPPVRLNLVQAFRITFTNDQFLYFLPTFIFFSMGISLLLATLPYYVQEVLGKEDEGFYVSALTSSAIAVVLLSLPFVYRLAVLRGKAWVYGTAMLLAAAYLPSMFFMGFIPAIPKVLQTFLFVPFLGVPMAAVFTFPNAIMADIIDYDELRTGMRREAMYYGTQATLEKMASALFPAILALLLTLGGTADNPLGIRLVGPVAGVSVLLAFLTFRRYSLPDTVTAETVKPQNHRTTEP